MQWLFSIVGKCSGWHWGLWVDIAHECGGWDQSIGSTVFDAIVRSWLWSTATTSHWSASVHYCKSLIIDPTFCGSRFSTGRLLAIEDFTFTLGHLHNTDVTNSRLHHGFIFININIIRSVPLFTPCVKITISDPLYSPTLLIDSCSVKIILNSVNLCHTHFSKHVISRKLTFFAHPFWYITQLGQLLADTGVINIDCYTIIFVII